MFEKMIVYRDLGRLGYAAALDKQRQQVEARRLRKTGDTIFLVEHDPVFTMGRSAGMENLLCSPGELKKLGITFETVNRGGDITYHGPGQLVCYPIIRLEGEDRDLHRLARDYEAVIIKALAQYGINGYRIESYTGVWVDDKKIAAIGVGVRDWVTFHGFALNVKVDLTPFSYIHPCGIKDRGVTSMSLLLQQDIDMGNLKKVIVDSFGAVFSATMVRDVS